MIVNPTRLKAVIKRCIVAGGFVHKTVHKTKLSIPPDNGERSELEWDALQTLVGLFCTNYPLFLRPLCPPHKAPSTHECLLDCSKIYLGPQNIRTFWHNMVHQKVENILCSSESYSASLAFTGLQVTTQCTKVI